MTRASHHATSVAGDEDYRITLKRLIAFRVVFALLLLGSAFAIQSKALFSSPDSPLRFFYGLTVFVLICSLIYIWAYYRLKDSGRQVFVQIGIDTFIVTALVYLSGGFSSYYTFLFPVVPIYASILVSRKRTLIIAMLVSVQYIALIGLESVEAIPVFLPDWGQSAAGYHWGYLTYKILLVVIACFAVSLLSSYLAGQAREARRELKAMQDHVRRVDKMASLGEMAAGLAHEIKNPLAAMTGSIQLLSGGAAGDPDQDKLMRIVTREANRLSSLVNNFLLFAKTPAGNVKPVCLTKEIEETLVLLEKDGTHRQQVDFDDTLNPDLWVEIDPVHFRQILWNLLLNALEAIEENGQVAIGVTPQDDHVTIEVSDNGIGIAKGDLERIFLPFYSSKPRGTGLGLSIIHNLLEGYNSRLDIHSAPGQGTTVTFRLKRIQPPRPHSTVKKKTV